MKPASYAPLYAGLYPDMAEIARKHGYALAVHGSLARDLDLVCIPWTESPADPWDVVMELTREFALMVADQGEIPTQKPHGRMVYSLVLKHGHGIAVDLSFMPRRPCLASLPPA